MEITKIKLKDIKPYEGNAKKHPAEQIRQIEESIREFGNNDPIAVDESNVIIEGHGRYIALRNLGYEEAECIVLKGLSEEQKNAYRLVHNQLTMNSGWDMETLAKELSEITMDMTRFDFEIPELDDIDAVTEDEVPAERETDIKEGDMFRLGDHTLLCGDSASERDVSRLMEGTKADMMMTDPPYNVDIRNSSGMTIKNDKLGKDQFKELLNGAMANASRSLKAGGVFYVWYGDIEDIAFRQACFGNGLEIKECLIWVKNHFTLGRQDYQWRHEPCLYGWKEGSHYFLDDRSQSTVIEDRMDIRKMKKEELIKALEEILSPDTPTTVIHENKPVKDDDHPTMKPVKLIARLIANSSRKRETVVDLFGGSGTTLIACEQLGRKCRMMELDPIYCDVIIRRWEKLTGKKATKIGGKEND